MAVLHIENKAEELILHELYAHPGGEAILVPTMFQPPLMLTNIFQTACQLKRKGFTTGPDRRLGGWHLRLLEPGVSFCQSNPVAPAASLRR